MYFASVWAQHLDYLPLQEVKSYDGLTFKTDVSVTELVDIAAGYCRSSCEREQWRLAMQDA